MREEIERGLRRCGVLALVVSGLAGCSPTADMSGVAKESGRSVKRYDITQALAANDKVVVAGTQSGVVLVSADQGKTWKRQVLGNVSLTDLKTCPDGSFVGLDFYHQVWSADASGNGWKASKLEAVRTALALACDGQGRWWVAGTGAKIAVSPDKGANWTVTDFGKDAQLTTLQFPDAQHGIVTGEFGLVATTSDGGATWKLESRLPKEFYPYGALFVSAEEGWASGIAGQIQHTVDGGKTWTRQTNASGAALYRLFLHDGHPYGVGSGGVVARLEGSEWRGVSYPDALPVFLGSAASLPGQSAIAVGGPGGLLRVIGTATK